MTRRSSRIAALAAAAVVFSAALSHAEHASVELRYAGAKAAPACPDEATFRGLVAARLGYDPFTGTGPRVLAVDFERRGNEVAGHLSFRGADAGKPSERTLHARPSECFELGTSLALVAAVAVDPDTMKGNAEAPPPLQEPKPVSPPPPPEPPPPTEARKKAEPVASERSVRLELGALLPVGVTPAVLPGARVGAGLGFGAWSLDAEGLFLLPGARQNAAGPGEVSAFVVAGSLVPCVDPVAARHLGLELCAVGSLGALRSTARQVTRAAPKTDLFATVGPRAAFFVLLSSAVGLGASAEVPVALARTRLHIEQAGRSQEVWAEPAVGFIGAISVVARLK